MALNLTWNAVFVNGISSSSPATSARQVFHIKRKVFPITDYLWRLDGNSQPKRCVEALESEGYKEGERVTACKFLSDIQRIHVGRYMC